MISWPVRLRPSGEPGRDLALLTDREGDAKLLSGGYSLLPREVRLAQPALLVDLRDVTGLDGISEQPTTTSSIGARATHRQIRNAGAGLSATRTCSSTMSPADRMGDPQVRTGTIGGSVAYVGPGIGLARSIRGRPATIVCRSQTGERTIAARDFFVDTFQTALEPNEVLTEIRIPRRPRQRRRVREAGTQGRRLRDRGRGGVGPVGGAVISRRPASA